MTALTQKVYVAFFPHMSKPKPEKEKKPTVGGAGIGNPFLGACVLTTQEPQQDKGTQNGDE
jgi:hypothetical protein